MVFGDLMYFVCSFFQSTALDIFDLNKGDPNFRDLSIVVSSLSNRVSRITSLCSEVLITV